MLCTALRGKRTAPPHPPNPVVRLPYPQVLGVPLQKRTLSLSTHTHTSAQRKAVASMAGRNSLTLLLAFPRIFFNL